MNLESEGQRLSAAFNAWAVSDEGVKCLAGRTDGVYLKNRLERAYQQGWADGRVDERINPPLPAAYDRKKEHA